MSTEDYRKFHDYLRELGDNTKIQQRLTKNNNILLSKEHLFKEGWTEYNNSTMYLYRGDYEIEIFDDSLCIKSEGRNTEPQTHYQGNLPNLRQWEVLKGLLNLV